MPTPPPTTRSKAAETAPITLLLTNEQLAQLDEVSAVIRRNSGRYVSRSALLRAITAAALTLRTDWKLCREEDEVCLSVLARLSATFDPRGGEQKFRQLKPGTNLIFAKSATC